MNGVYLSEMLSVVQIYIAERTGYVVSIVLPRNDKELQLLGKAYDIAVNYLNGKAKAYDIKYDIKFEW